MGDRDHHQESDSYSEDEGEISSVLIDSNDMSTSYGDMMMLERVLSMHGRESGETSKNFRVAYVRLQKVYETRLSSLERALQRCVSVTKNDPVVKQMRHDDASSKFASERVSETFRKAINGESERQIRVLANQIAARDSALVASEKKQNKLLEKIHSMSMELRESRSRVQTLLVSQSQVIEEDVSMNNKDKNTVQFEVIDETFTKQLTRSARKATKRLRDQLEMSQQHLRESEVERLALRDKYIEMGEKMEAAFRVEINELRSQKNDLNSRLKRSDVDLKRSRQRIEQLLEERDRIETLAEKLRKDLLGMQSRAQEESSTFRDETSSFAREKSKLIEQMALLRSKSEVLRRDNADLDSKFRSVSERCEELRVKWDTEHNTRECLEKTLRDTKEDLNSRLNAYELANLKLTEEHKVALRDCVNAEKRLASQHLEAVLSNERADHRREIELLKKKTLGNVMAEVSQRVDMESNRRIEIAVSKERAAHLQAMESLESRLQEKFSKEILIKVETENIKWKTRYEEERRRHSHCERELTRAREEIQSLNTNMLKERRETLAKIKKMNEDHESKSRSMKIDFETKMIEVSEKSRSSFDIHFKQEIEERKKLQTRARDAEMLLRSVLSEIDRLSFSTSTSDRFWMVCQDEDYSEKSCKDVVEFVRSCFEKCEIELNDVRRKLEVCQSQLETTEREEDENRSLAVELETKSLRRSLRTAEAELASLRELANRPSDASTEVKRRMKELMRAVEVRDRELQDMRAMMVEANKALKQGRKELRRSRRRERNAVARMTNELVVDDTSSDPVVKNVVRNDDDNDDDDDGNDDRGNRNDMPLRASDLTTSGDGDIETEIRKLRDMKSRLSSSKSRLSSSTSRLYRRRRKKQNQTTAEMFSRSHGNVTTRAEEPPVLEKSLRHESFSSSELGLPASPSTRRQSEESFDMTIYYTASAVPIKYTTTRTTTKTNVVPPPGLDNV